MEENKIVNRVSNSALVTLNLEELHPSHEIVEFDLRELLFQGLVLREKDLREFVRTHDWRQYRDKDVSLFCSADAIIPTWAFMLVAIALQPVARSVVFGNKAQVIANHFHDALSAIDWEQYRNAKVVIKGCSDVHVPESVFVEAATRLRAVDASIMYGEPCSTVPLYKHQKPGG